MKIKISNNEKGFALPLTLMLLVVLTIMGTTLITITSNEHTANNDRDSNQQSFYAAESGIVIAKKWMALNVSILDGSPPNNLSSNIRFCKTSFFPGLLTNNNGFWTERKSMNEVINASGVEATRLSKFSFEYFIAYSPDQNGNNLSAKMKPGTSSKFYTIYSCGCNESKNNCSNSSNIIIPLEAVVTLVK